MSATSTQSSVETVELIFQVVSIMVPVVTGYLVLFVGAIGRLWELSSERQLRLAWRFISFTVVAGVLSLACWAGAMATGIMFSTGEYFHPWWLLWQKISPEQALRLSRHFLSFGYSLFILSIVFGMWACLRSIRR